MAHFNPKFSFSFCFVWKTLNEKIWSKTSSQLDVSGGGWFGCFFDDLLDEMVRTSLTNTQKGFSLKLFTFFVCFLK